MDAGRAAGISDPGNNTHFRRRWCEPANEQAKRPQADRAPPTSLESVSRQVNSEWRRDWSAKQQHSLDFAP